MREKHGKGVRHAEISRGRVKGEIILHRRDFKEPFHFSCGVSSFTPLGLTSFLDPHPALALPQGGTGSDGAKIVAALRASDPK
jgi:hypothetical protein